MLFEDICGELEALQEVYEGLQYVNSDLKESVSGVLEVWVSLGDHETIVTVGDNNCVVRHLSGVTASFDVSLGVLRWQVKAQWLSRTFEEKVRERLQRLCEQESSGLLWKSFLFLELECIEFLFGSPQNSVLQIDLNNIFEKDEVNTEELFRFIYKYDLEKKEYVFNNSIIECGSCLVNKKGFNSICLRGCGDVFCCQCAVDYFNTQIKNGDLKLKCLICSGNVDYDEIKGILDNDVFERWDQLVFNYYIKMSDVDKPCPRCRAISSVDDNCGICPRCQYVFCSKCKKTYHSNYDCKTHHPCPICENSSEVEYSRGFCKKCDYAFCYKCENAYHKGLTCEQGKQNRLLGLSKQGLTLRIESKSCPKCDEVYIKVGGCNKMLCGICLTYFCYMCNQIIDQDNPYSHFNVLNNCHL